MIETFIEGFKRGGIRETVAYTAIQNHLNRKDPAGFCVPLGVDNRFRFFFAQC